MAFVFVGRHLGWVDAGLESSFRPMFREPKERINRRCINLDIQSQPIQVGVGDDIIRNTALCVTMRSVTIVDMKFS